jgi:hypothetical protein
MILPDVITPRLLDWAICVQISCPRWKAKPKDGPWGFAL